MLLFRYKMFRYKMIKGNALFVSDYLFLYCIFFFASVLIYNRKDKIKNSYIMIINIVA